MRSAGIALLAMYWAVNCFGSALDEQVRQLVEQGDSARARGLLTEAVRQDPGDAAVLQSYAEFLDRYGDPGAREAYGKLLDTLSGPEAAARRGDIAYRLAILDLLASDKTAADRHFDMWRAAAGKGPPSPPPPPGADLYQGEIELPGPLESFARIAAFSPALAPREVLPAVGRNVVLNGYRASSSYEGLQETEYLKIIIRYLSQARELEQIAGESGFIRIEACESAQTAELLRVLGYRMRGACGGEVVLETVNASRAFLTVDSGFPLAELEQALRVNRLFQYDYRPTRLPVLFGGDYWLTDKDREKGTPFIDAFIGDPSLCRAYLALSKMRSDVAGGLRESSPAEKLKAFAHVLDFFGGMFAVENGRALIPGGDRSARVWRDLVGEDPERGVAFYERLITKDDGWLASFYDSLLRTRGPALDYITEPERMKRFYAAIRGKVTSPGPARPVFRSNSDLMLLATRLRMEPNGQPHIPGGLATWKQIFAEGPKSSYDAMLKKAAPRWSEPDDLLEALFGLCRKAVGNEPLSVFLGLSDVNRHRRQPLEPATVLRLARSYRDYGEQYSLFAEVETLSDATILAYLDTAEELSRIGNRLLQADVIGSMQALVGIWQIAVRNGAIGPGEADAILAELLGHFRGLDGREALFDHTVAAVRLLHDKTGGSGKPLHDHFMALLAGSLNPRDVATHEEVLAVMSAHFEAQKLAPLDMVFDVAEHLTELARGAEMNTAVINRLETRLSEIELHREGLTSVERTAASPDVYTERHIQQQRKLRLLAEIRKAAGSPEKLRGLRADLTPLLRDTLVGFNYIHYAPPGAEIIRANPLFVRSHHFLEVGGINATWKETDVYGAGWPASAGGRLVGSLIGLPYALAEAEQNFFVPLNEQALIWADLVPQMILSAKIPRWWNVTPVQLHWVALHVRSGERLLAAAALDRDVHQAVRDILFRQATPARVERVDRLLLDGRAGEALEHVSPSELFLIGAEMSAQGKGIAPFSAEIRWLAASHADEVSEAAISRAFGSPKPRLTNSYRPELLHLRTFPTLMGYSSRIMAESWESNLLYFAALADELHLRPSQLNRLAPEWTQRTVEAIFATHLEDWPAVLRSLQSLGEEVRAASRSRAGATQQAFLER